MGNSFLGNIWAMKGSLRDAFLIESKFLLNKKFQMVDNNIVNNLGMNAASKNLKRLQISKFVFQDVESQICKRRRR